MKILIDGENFRHQIAHVLLLNKKIIDGHAYFKFDTQNFLKEALATQVTEAAYYTTRIKQPRQKIPVKLQKRITSINEANRKFIADLANQEIVIVKAGYLRVRESGSCVYCGKKTMVLQEKGVDVRVATDLVLASQKDKQVVMISSDSDLVPALQAVRAQGVEVIYFCYAGWLNRSVAAQSSKTITFDDKLVLKYFRGIK